MVSVSSSISVIVVLSFLVGLHCCDDFAGCWGDTDFMRILHFSREYFIVVCIFMPWSPGGDALRLAYGLKTLLFLNA